jgi:hypothetical protein
MSEPARLIVLAEDEHQHRLVRHYLYRLGYLRHDVYSMPVPSGRGSGEQWVRERYSDMLQAWRARAAKARTALIVVIDADTETVAERQQQLANILRRMNTPPRGDQDPVVHFIPKRNVETWVLCLRGDQVNEATDYKHSQGVEESIRPSAQTLLEWTRPNAELPLRCVPSLREGIEEAKRLERAELRVRR